MKKHVARRTAGLALAALMALTSAGVGTAEATEVERHRPAEQVVALKFKAPTNRVVKAQLSQTLDLTTGGDDSGGNFCDNHAVGDDITDCDLGEIAWECPDDPGPSNENCTGHKDGSFPSDDD